MILPDGFNHYQQLASKTNTGTNGLPRPVYTTLGLVGEAGELANKVKKIFRDSAGVITPEMAENLKQELGDVLWYLSQVASDLNLSLQDVADANILKLASRAERNQIHGVGDER